MIYYGTITQTEVIDMFGLVTAHPEELTDEEKARYLSFYCGICRSIRSQCSQLCRLALSYDMVFLALVLSSLYEPEEVANKHACMLHPIKKRPWASSEILSYAADINIALAYYSADDNWRDDKNVSALAQRRLLRRYHEKIAQKYPRQCAAIASSIAKLQELERTQCANPDEPANCFGNMMAQLFVWKNDLWQPTLEQLGMGLGRFIYLADAAVDFEKDKRKNNYNPLVFLHQKPAPNRWEEYLVLSMAMCADAYERLPLVQDKQLMDKILYSGVWAAYKRKLKKHGRIRDDGRSI